MHTTHLQSTLLDPPNCLPKWVIHKISCKCQSWKLHVRELEFVEESPHHKNKHGFCKFGGGLGAKGLLEIHKMVVDIPQICIANQLPRVLVKH